MGVFKLKKILSLTLATTFLASSFMGTSASAQSTEDYKINWDSVWENVETLSDEVSFGGSNEPADESTITPFSYSTYATGSTSLSKSTADNTVTSTGKTTGKTSSTTVSATTSIKRGATILGESSKKIAVGKSTATAKFSVTHRSFTGTTPYAGLTVHTATSGGVLYDKASTKSATY